MEIKATQRLLSQKTNQEKLTHYKRRLNTIKQRLRTINPDTAPITTRKLLKRAVRLELHIQDLRSRHQH